MPEDAGKGVFHFQSEVTLRLTTGVSIIAYAQAGAQGDCEGGVLETGLGDDRAALTQRGLHP